MVDLGFEIRVGKKADHCFCEMLTVDKDVDCVQVGTRAAVECDLVHNLPV